MFWRSGPLALKKNYFKAKPDPGWSVNVSNADGSVNVSNVDGDVIQVLKLMVGLLVVVVGVRVNRRLSHAVICFERWLEKPYFIFQA